MFKRPILFCFKLFFLSTTTYFVFSWFICSPNFLVMFSIPTKSFLISISFFPINTMSVTKVFLLKTYWAAVQLCPVHAI